MSITFTKITYDRKSISPHTDKEFLWNGQKFWLDKETQTGNGVYRLWEYAPQSNGKVGTNLVINYFADGWSWKRVEAFVEGYLTCACGEQHA